jgi:hypothetical protein
MGQRQPFVLDPNYRDKLTSDAWRQQFLRNNRKDVESQRTLAIFSVALPGVLVAAGAVLLLLGYCLDKGKVFYVLGAVFGGFGLFVGIPLLLILPGERAKGRAFRKWAVDLTLVEGELTDCTGEMVRGGEDDSFYVTAHYRAVAPNGKEVTGWNRHLRDDLHQQPLPAAGMTVWVMTTPNGSWAGML